MEILTRQDSLLTGLALPLVPSLRSPLPVSPEEWGVHACPEPGELTFLPKLAGLGGDSQLPEP